MARQKKVSSHIEKAQQRLAALTAISATLDLGNTLTLVKFRTDVTAVQAKQDAYNALLSQVDQAYNDLQTTEKAIRDLSERMLIGVASKYGKDSNEYEMAGGVRKSERKRPIRKKTA